MKMDTTSMMDDDSMTVTTSAPGKLMLLGEHAVVYGRPCLVTAVDRRIRVAVERTTDSLVHLSAPSLGVEDWAVPLAHVETTVSPVEVRFLHAVVRTVAEHHTLPCGLRIRARSEFSDTLGLGSSAAVTIAATAALARLLGLTSSKPALFRLAFDAVHSVQGVGSGFDLAASLYGGTLYFCRTPSPEPKVAGTCDFDGPEIQQLDSDPLPLVVGYSGTKADTVSLVRRVAQRRERHPALIAKIFDGMARLVEEGREALLACDWERLGENMSLSQSLLDALGVGTPRLAQLVRVATEAGAYGAKLSGAGGGDCMIAVVSLKRRDEVTKAIERAGAVVLRLQTGAPGVRTQNTERLSMMAAPGFSSSDAR
jgi:mevalonate kinase